MPSDNWGLWIADVLGDVYERAIVCLNNFIYYFTLNKFFSLKFYRGISINEPDS